MGPEYPAILGSAGVRVGPRAGALTVIHDRAKRVCQRLHQLECIHSSTGKGISVSASRPIMDAKQMFSEYLGSGVNEDKEAPGSQKLVVEQEQIQSGCSPI